MARLESLTFCSAFLLLLINEGKLPAGYANHEERVYPSIRRVGTALRGTARNVVSADKTGAVGAVEKKDQEKEKKPGDDRDDATVRT